MTQQVPPFAAMATSLPAASSEADEAHAALIALVRLLARAEAQRFVAQSLSSKAARLGRDEG